MMMIVMIIMMVIVLMVQLIYSQLVDIRCKGDTILVH